MNQRITIALSLLAGAVFGATAIQGLHAQAKPGALVVIDISELTGRAKVSGEHADAGKGFAVKCQNERQAQLEWRSLQRAMDRLNSRVELPKAVSGLGLGFLMRVGDEVGL